MGEITFHEKYKPLWTTDCFITLVTGGRGSGKSFAVGDAIENLTFEQGHKILFTRYTLDSASDSIIPEFQEKISIEGHDDCFHVTKKDVINKRSGSEILFRGIKTSSGDQTAKLKSIQGLTTWVLDEAEELTDEEVFNKIKQSVRKKGIKNRIILIMNPRDINHWVYKRFFESPGVDPKFNGEHEGVCYIHTCYLENLDNLSDEFIEEAEKCKKYTPELYAYEYLGEWVLSLEGAILKMNRLKRYKKLNDEGVNLIAIDSADEGTNHFAAPIGRLLNNSFYVTDAIFNMFNLTVNEEICKERFERHKIDRCYIEINSAGAYFKRNLKLQNPSLYIWGQFSKANKMGRMLAQSGFILENFYWPENPNEELLRFMKEMCMVTPETKEEDDALDSISLMSAMIRKEFSL
jgi:phage terminase large subunit-like protein